VGVGVDGWRHPFSRLKSAGTQGFGLARTTTGVDGWHHLFSRLKSAGTRGFGVARTTTGVDGWHHPFSRLKSVDTRGALQCERVRHHVIAEPFASKRAARGAAVPDSSFTVQPDQPPLPSVDAAACSVAACSAAAFSAAARSASADATAIAGSFATGAVAGITQR
jgi:hypothetical protein